MFFVLSRAWDKDEATSMTLSTLQHLSWAQNLRSLLFYLQTWHYRHCWSKQYTGHVSYELRNWAGSPWSICGSVVEHRSGESESLRFDSSWGLRIFSLSHARDKTKNIFRQVFFEREKLAKLRVRDRNVTFSKPRLWFLYFLSKINKWCRPILTFDTAKSSHTLLVGAGSSS